MTEVLHQPGRSAAWAPATNHTKHKLHPQITATLFLEHILYVKTLIPLFHCFVAEFCCFKPFMILHNRISSSDCLDSPGWTLRSSGDMLLIIPKFILFCCASAHRYWKSFPQLLSEMLSLPPSKLYWKCICWNEMFMQFDSFLWLQSAMPFYFLCHCLSCSLSYCIPSFCFSSTCFLV